MHTYLFNVCRHKLRYLEFLFILSSTRCGNRYFFSIYFGTILQNEIDKSIAIKSMIVILMFLKPDFFFLI